MTTRYGFEGGDPKTGTPAEKPNVVKTVFGREAHLPALKGRAPEAVSLNRPKAAADAPRTNQPTVMAGLSQASTKGVVPSGGPESGANAGPQRTGKGAGASSAPSASSKSARPGVARFLGRRNTAGNIVPLTQTEIQLPTAAWVRPVLTVGVAAAGSFLIVAALLWIAGPKAPPPLQTHKAPHTSPKLPTTQLVAPAPAPAPVPPQAPPAAPPARSAAAPKSTVKHRAKWAAPKPKKPVDPDAPLPPTFF